MNQKIHVPIDKAEEVKGITSGSGLVNKTNWNPGTGAKEREAMAREKQAAFEAMIAEEKKRNDPYRLRFEAIEHELHELKQKLVTFEDLYGKK